MTRKVTWRVKIVQILDETLLAYGWGGGHHGLHATSLALAVSFCVSAYWPAFPALPQPSETQAAGTRLKVSDNKRFLVKEDGTAFFYLGDTAWELFHRLNREEADRYLENRAKKGFTVIQAVALAEIDGLNTPNAYGHRALIDNDPTKPDIKDGPANDYWDQVDYIVNKANSLGLYIGFLPTWGDKWNRSHGAGGGSFTVENAAIYGEWLGRRYKDKALIWILGGTARSRTTRTGKSSGRWREGWQKETEVST